MTADQQPAPPTPDPDGWVPDPVLEARRQELYRRLREENRRPTPGELDGLGADLWRSDEEFERFLAYTRGGDPDEG